MEATSLENISDQGVITSNLNSKYNHQASDEGYASLDLLDEEVKKRFNLSYDDLKLVKLVKNSIESLVITDLEDLSKKKLTKALQDKFDEIEASFAGFCSLDIKNKLGDAYYSEQEKLREKLLEFFIFAFDLLYKENLVLYKDKIRNCSDFIIKLYHIYSDSNKGSYKFIFSHAMESVEEARNFYHKKYSAGCWDKEVLFKQAYKDKAYLPIKIEALKGDKLEELYNIYKAQVLEKLYLYQAKKNKNTQIDPNVGSRQGKVQNSPGIKNKKLKANFIEANFNISSLLDDKFLTLSEKIKTVAEERTKIDYFTFFLFAQEAMILRFSLYFLHFFLGTEKAKAADRIILVAYFFTIGLAVRAVTLILYLTLYIPAIEIYHSAKKYIYNYRSETDEMLKSFGFYELIQLAKLNRDKGLLESDKERKELEITKSIFSKFYDSMFKQEIYGQFNYMSPGNFTSYSYKDIVEARKIFNLFADAVNNKQYQADLMELEGLLGKTTISIIRLYREELKETTPKSTEVLTFVQGSIISYIKALDNFYEKLSCNSLLRSSLRDKLIAYQLPYSDLTNKPVREEQAKAPLITC